MDELLQEIQITILSYLSGNDYWHWSITNKNHHKKWNDPANIKLVLQLKGYPFRALSASYYAYSYARYFFIETEHRGPTTLTSIKRSIRYGKFTEQALQRIVKEKYNIPHIRLPHIVTNEVARLLQRKDLHVVYDPIFNQVPIPDLLYLGVETLFLLRPEIRDEYNNPKTDLGKIKTNDKTWFVVNKVTQFELCVALAAKKNRHDILFSLLENHKDQKEKLKYHLLQGSSDATTTAILLAQTELSNFDIEVGRRFIECDNNSALDVLLKYHHVHVRPEESDIIILSLLKLSIVYDALACFQLLHSMCEKGFLADSLINFRILKEKPFGILQVYQPERTLFTRALNFLF